MAARRFPRLTALLILVSGLAGDRFIGHSRAGDQPLPAHALLRLGTSCFQNGSDVTVLAFSPDGKLLASAGGQTAECLPDTAVRLWDVATGQVLHVLDGDGYEITALLFAPDGRTLATVSVVAVRLWDVATGKERHKFKRLLGPVWFSADSKEFGFVHYVHTGGRWKADQGIMADVRTGTQMRTLTAEAWLQKDLAAAAYRADGTLVGYSAGRDASECRLWDLSNDKEIRTFKGEAGEFGVVLTAAGGKVLATGGASGDLRLWDVQTGKVLCLIQGNRFASNRGELFNWMQALAADATILGSVGQNGALALWDVRTGKKLHALSGHEGGATAVAFAPDGKTLASGGHDHRIRLWDVASGKERLPRTATGHQGRVAALAYAPNGKILASVSADKTLRLWDADTGKELRTLAGDEEGIGAVAFAPDGSLLASASGDYPVRLWDPNTGKEIGMIKELKVGWLGFSPDGKVLATLGRPDQGPPAALWDVRSRKRLCELRSGAAFAFAPDGKTIAQMPYYRNMWLWDVAKAARGDPGEFGEETKDGVPRERDKRIIRTWQCQNPGQPRGAMAFSGDGKTLASTGDNSDVRLWDVAAEKEFHLLKGHRQDVRSLAFSPDGKLLASASADRTVRLWEVATGAEIRVLTGHHGAVNSVAFAGDGKMLASASDDSTILIWRVYGGTPGKKDWTEQEVQALWADLAGSDTIRALAALEALAASLDALLPFMRQHLPKADPALKQRLARLIADLGSGNFQVREKASHELATSALRAALADKPALDLSRRLETLVKQLTPRSLTTEELRWRRVIQALEVADRAPTRPLLEAIAQDAPYLSQRQDAAAALARLGQRSREKP